MKKIFRVLKFESIKLLKRKDWIVFIIIFAAALAGILAYVTQPDNSTPLSGSSSREALLQSYVYQRDISKAYYDFLTKGETTVNQPLVDENAQNADIFLEQYYVYDYFLKTRTVQTDYVSFNNLFAAGKYESSENMLQFGYTAYFVLAIAALIIPLLAVCGNFDRKIVKNLLTSDISRDAVIGGKILFSFVSLAAIFFLVFAIGLIFGFQTPSVVGLAFTGTSVAAVTAVEFYCSKMAAAFVSMLVIAAMSVFFAAAIKKSFWGGAVALGTYLLSVVSYFGAYRATGINSYILQRYVPFVNLQEIKLDFVSPMYWAVVVPYVVAAAGLLAGAWALLKKRDV